MSLNPCVKTLAVILVCMLLCEKTLTVSLPLRHHMTSQEECFPSDCLMSNDIQVEFRLLVHSCCSCWSLLHSAILRSGADSLLRAIAVTWGWNGHWNKSQHRKLTLEKKILPPLLPGFEPATFQSRVRRSNHWAIPAFSFPVTPSDAFTVAYHSTALVCIYTHVRLCENVCVRQA